MPRSRKSKNQESAPKILPGHVAVKRVTCGKSNCRCARGHRHTAFYHITYSEGVQQRQYIRRAEVEQVRAACQAHRELQAELLTGRRRHTQFMRLVKSMLQDLAEG